MARAQGSAAGARATEQCPECGKPFDRPASLGAHRRAAHGIAGTSRTGGRSAAGGASRSRWSGWSTGRHASITPRGDDPQIIDRDAVHSAEKLGVGELGCPECSKRFDRPASLGAHRRLAHGVAGTSRASSSSGARQGSRPSRTPSRGRGDSQSVDRDALLQQLFPGGMPARESVLQRVNAWLDEAEELAGFE